MSAPGSLAARPAATGGTARRRGWRLWVVIAVAVTLAVGVAVWAGRGDTRYGAPLDPRNPGPDGAEALARVLADAGVDVEIVRSADALSDAAPDERTTVVVTTAGSLSPSTTDRLFADAAAARVILVEPPARVLVDLDVTGVTRLDGAAVPADCTGAPAEPPVEPPVELTGLAGLELSVDGADAYPGTGCFPVLETDHAVLTALTGHGADAWLFGAGQALSNDQVLRGDNAAIALRLLGGSDRLVWYVPDPADAASGETVGLTSLLPDWLLPTLALALIAMIAVVGWRGRRFGPLSVEPLPVVVRAVETTVSRGRLYRRADDRAHAAAVLRRAARRRLAARLDLGRAASTDDLVAALAATTQRAPGELSALLAADAPAPTTDADLVRLARALQSLSPTGEDHEQ